MNPHGSWIRMLCRTREQGEFASSRVGGSTDAIAEAIAHELGREITYRPVETDGAPRAAAMIAESL